MTYKTINRGEDATILMPLLEYAQQSAELFPLMHKLLTVYVISMPVNLGGGVVGVCWTREIAERLVDGMMNSPEMQNEIKFRKEHHLEPVGEYVIEQTVIGGLSLIEKG